MRPGLVLQGFAVLRKQFKMEDLIAARPAFGEAQLAGDVAGRSIERINDADFPRCEGLARNRFGDVADAFLTGRPSKADLGRNVDAGETICVGGQGIEPLPGAAR